MPLPDGPTMPTRGEPTSRATSSATSRSRPKKNAASARPKDARPLYGQTTLPRDRLVPLAPRPHRLQVGDPAREPRSARRRSARSRPCAAPRRSACCAGLALRAQSAAMRCASPGTPPLRSASCCGVALLRRVEPAMAAIASAPSGPSRMVSAPGGSTAPLGVRGRAAARLRSGTRDARRPWRRRSSRAGRGSAARPRLRDGRRRARRPRCSCTSAASSAASRVRPMPGGPAEDDAEPRPVPSPRHAARRRRARLAAEHRRGRS